MVSNHLKDFNSMIFTICEPLDTNNIESSHSTKTNLIC